MASRGVVGFIAAAIVLLVGGVAVVLSGESPRRDEALARLQVMSGPVEVRAFAGPFRRAGPSEPVFRGTTVRTGERALAEIEYFDGSLTRIGPKTNYEIVELERAPNRTEIVGKIGLGETFHDVKELTGSGSRFEVQESNAIAAVRGTRFAARCLPPLPCGIAVVEGVVVVTPSSGEPVSVEGGNRITIDDAGLLGQETAISPDDAWINQNRDLG